MPAGHAVHVPGPFGCLPGQHCGLHASESVSGAQPTPPKRGSTLRVRVRVRLPPPHETEQLPQSCHALSLQSTGHSLVLQLCVSSSAPQAVPPWSGAIFCVRLRTCTPLPHVSEHPPQLPQAFISQWIGHAFTKQLDERALSASAHAAPACGPVLGHASTLTVRLSTLVPWPQVRSHAPHAFAHAFFPHSSPYPIPHPFHRAFPHAFARAFFPHSFLYSILHSSPHAFSHE